VEDGFSDRRDIFLDAVTSAPAVIGCLNMKIRNTTADFHVSQSPLLSPSRPQKTPQGGPGGGFGNR
jgi:hypothetical protein